MNNTPQLENGFIRIATDIAKYLARTYMSSYESQIMWAVFIKTYGYNKKEDWISNSQFVELTDMHKAHVSRTIKKLIKRGIVTQTGNKIAFQKDSRLWKKLPKQVTVTQTGTLLPKQATQLPKQADTIDNIQKTMITKDNIYRKYSSLRDIDQPVMEEIANKYHVPVAFVQSKFDDMSNWLMAKGRSYRNYKAALANWVKKDALQIYKEQHDKSKIGFINPA